MEENVGGLKDMRKSKRNIIGRERAGKN